MDKELQVIHTQTHNGLPLATIRNFPGCDADMTPAEMREMAAALEAAAAECEQRPMGRREFKRVERRYPLSAKSMVLTRPLIETPRVEAVIDQAIAKFPSFGAKAQATYYESVHQALAPLARDLERELRASTAQVDNLSALVRRLSHLLRKAAPDNDLPAKALDYLNRNGIATTAFRGTTEVQDD